MPSLRARLLLVLAMRLAPAWLLAQATGARAGETAFDPALAAPYFTDGAAGRAAERLRLEEYPAAAKGFAEYLRQRRAGDRKQATFLLAYAELKAGQFNNAAGHFDGLVRSYPLLADYHRLWSARAHLQAERPGECLKRAKQVPPGSPLDGEARLLRAEAEQDLGRPAAAAAEYRGYLDAYPQSWRASEARLRLAQALDGAHQAAEASAEWRRLFLEAPHVYGKEADAHLPEEARHFTAAEMATRAMVLFDNQRNAESEAEWRRVLAAGDVTPALTCVARFHLAQSIFKQRDRQRAAPLFDAAFDACTAAKDEELTVKSLYQGGRSWGILGDKDLAATKRGAAELERLWREHPAHSYADDARLREAGLFEALKEDGKVSELLTGLPDAFPDGDQKGEALWRLAFRAWLKGDADSAKRWLELELAKLPREDGWWQAGRTLYWLGRVAEHKGDSAAAVEKYRQTFVDYPLSYYALLAFNRLRERSPEQAEELLARFSAPAAEPWRFKPRALFGEAGFRRGVELARLGLGAQARIELGAVGILVPKKKESTAIDADQEELLWLAAVLYDRAGEVSLSHAIPRHLLTDYERTWPTGAAANKWRLSYPRGYADLIERNARANDLPPELEFAIVREESAFDPLMESFANAVGLTQLTAAPAARYAQGLPHDRIALRDPAINIAIGARELGALWHGYAGSAPLAIAGYNAGEGAVGRWLRDPDRLHLPLDEFIEDIPYDETRGYTKRVLASYFAYAWLYGPRTSASIPLLPQTLPLRRK